MEEIKGLVFDIQSYSVHDGPGCRTVLFMMGCPLRCQWCANPEGLEYRQRTLYRISKCVSATQGCRRCAQKCPKTAISVENSPEAKVNINWSICKTCDSMECLSACLTEALAPCGRWLSIQDVLKILNRDRQYWGKEGGVTFSGGDPVMQHKFLIPMLKACREAYIHTTIETSACFDPSIIMEVMKYVDFAFVDIKHMDNQKHVSKTNVSNQQILNNVKLLASDQFKGRLVIRIPVIPNFNDDDENILATAKFAQSVELQEINILPFHRLGDSKWRQCGIVYPYSEVESPSEEKIKHIQDLIQSQGIVCYIGHETPF